MGTPSSGIQGPCQPDTGPLMGQTLTSRRWKSGYLAHFGYLIACSREFNGVINFGLLPESSQMRID